MKNYIKQTHLFILSILILIHSVYFTAASFFRYDNFYAGRLDLGNMTQTVWNTAHGRIFQFTDPDGLDNLSRLSYHADFILMVFSPFYWLWESPKVLLLFQVVVAGLGAVFVYLITEKLLHSKHIALAFALSYLLNPALNWSILFDFHAVVLATTFLLGALYFSIEKKVGRFLMFALLAGITKEQVWFILALFGVLIYVSTKKKLLGFSVFALSLSMFYFLIWHAIPAAASTHGHFALSYFEEGGNEPFDIIEHSIAAPRDTLAKLLDQGRIDYLKSLFLPLGFLPALFPFWLVFPSIDIVFNLISDKEELQHIYYHYTATITPFLYLSGIYAVRYANRLFRSDGWICAYIIMVACIGAYTYGPLPGSQDPNTDMFTDPLIERNEINAVLSRIPVENSVAATNELGAHLSHRESIYSTATDVTEADYVAFLTRHPEEEEEEYNSELIGQLMQNNNFELWYKKHGMTVFKKRGIHSSF